MQYNEKLKELRKTNNLYQKDLAKVCNVNAETYRLWEVGKTQPSIEHLITLAKHYCVSTDYLLGLENENGMIVMQNELTEDENYLIDIVRQLNQKDKNTLYELADLMLKAKNIKK